MPPQFHYTEATRMRGGFSPDLMNLNMRQPEFVPKSKILTVICVVILAAYLIYCIFRGLIMGRVSDTFPLTWCSGDRSCNRRRHPAYLFPIQKA